MRYALWAAVALATLALAWFVFVRAPAITNYPSKGTELVALGDSLVSGTGASAGHDVVSALSGLVGRPIVNLGKPGDTTADVLARLKELDAYHPQVVLVLVGGNDYLRHVEDDTVFANVANIIEDIQGRGAIVLLVGIRGGVLADPYAPRFEQLARAYHVAYVPDALRGLFGDERYMSDQVHPNDAGYARLAARLAPVLQNLLQ